MDKKHDFTGIIITVVIAVILMSVIPIYNNMTSECPPCEEVPSYNIGDIVVNPDFSSGNYNVDKGSYDYLDDVTIIKDENLIPENIKKGINIFGVEGTYEEERGLPIDISSDYGIVIVTGAHGNFTQKDVDLSDPLEAYFVFTDGTNDVNVDGELLYYWGSNYSVYGEYLSIKYTFLFRIPSGYTKLKEFWLKSNEVWKREIVNVVVSTSGETYSMYLPEMDEGDSIPNEFTRIFSYSTPRGFDGGYNNPSVVTINLSTADD